MIPFPFQWAAPDIAARAEALKKEFDSRDLPREKLLELAAAHKAQGEWLEGILKSREADARLHALAFPACCTAPLGFEQSIQARGIAAVCSRIQLPFKGCRLAVDPECAKFFHIVDVKAGQRSAFVNCVPIAATLFPPIVGDWGSEEQERAHDKLRFGLPRVQPGGELTIEVQNLTDDRHEFRAAIWGHYIE